MSCNGDLNVRRSMVHLNVSRVDRQVIVLTDRGAMDDGSFLIWFLCRGRFHVSENQFLFELVPAGEDIKRDGEREEKTGVEGVAHIG